LIEVCFISSRFSDHAIPFIGRGISQKKASPCPYIEQFQKSKIVQNNDTMKIITRYLLKEFFTLFFISLLAFLLIYLVIDFFGKIDKFLEAGVSLRVTLIYFLYQTPFILQQMVPIAVLISVMLMLGIMNKHNEILALKNSGLSLFNLSYPLIVASLFIGIGSFFLAESFVPITSARANYIWATQVKKTSTQGTYTLSRLWFRGKDSIYQIRTYNGKKKTIEGLSIFFFDKDFTLRKRIDAQKAIWNEEGWLLSKGLIQEIQTDGSRRSWTFSSQLVSLPETPENFERAMKSLEEMSFWGLWNYTKKIRQEGYDSTRSDVELHTKMAFPFISIVLILVGIPLAFKKRRGGIPLSITIAIGISFLYLFTFGLSRSLALSGALPPLLGAWISNLLFSFFGMYLMLKADT
jgi:lipopolysaccharide export system permease protein